MASLKIKGLNKAFPSGETALYDVNLEAADKEFLVFLGGDSSGKSTLLRIVAGLDDATSGTVEINGKDMTDVEPKNRDIAMVFKNNTLYPALNVFDNMAFGLRLRKAPEALVRERVKVAAEILGLNDCLYRKPKVLTAAAKQRVAIGRAIVREPKLYLFDEPLSGLDDKLRLDMLNVIINLQARLEGTFVYATKNLSEALTIGTRIVVLKDGFVQQIDTPANLYDYPANTYVAFLIGSPTVNFIKKVKIVSNGNGYFAEFNGGKLE
ncbi:MAG: ABC transporter ATP-binding protein, partial [Clostridia bacterium]|nr:ABC transporter ATP-binding protein [Clostridia bacterium]